MGGASVRVAPSIVTHALPDEAWLAPGFIDVQVNGGGDVLFNADPTQATLLRIAAAHRNFGTTSLLATLISDTRETMGAALEAVRVTPSESGILGIHFEGPFLSPQKPGVHDPTKFRAPCAEDIELLTSLSGRPVLVTLAPELCRSALSPPSPNPAYAYPSVTRWRPTPRQNVRSSSGLTGFTHLFNAMRPLSSREPGPIAAALESANA